MERYITILPNSGAIQTALDQEELGKPYLVFNQQLDRIDWNTLSPQTGPVYSAMPLTFEILSGGTIVWQHGGDATEKTIEYSKDSGTTWTSITSTTAGTSFNVDAGDKVMFRGNNAKYAVAADYRRAAKFTSGGTAVFNVYGNIMSLIDSTGFTSMTAFTSENTFAFTSLFNGAKVVSAEHLILPATTLTGNCYQNMFYGCTSLTTAPVLPATTLASNCYASMFRNAGITSAPELPARGLVQGCYSYMFAGTPITTAPALPATTLTGSCYASMFSNCTSLTTAPVLPATTLASNCYQSMFSGCTSLTAITCLATDISATRCTQNWVQGVSASGTFFKNSNMSSWTTGTSGIPTGWVVYDYPGTPTHTTGVWLRDLDTGDEYSGSTLGDTYEWWDINVRGSFAIVVDGKYQRLVYDVSGTQYECGQIIGNDNTHTTGITASTNYFITGAIYFPEFGTVDVHTEDVLECVCTDVGLCDDGEGNCVDCAEL